MHTPVAVTMWRIAAQGLFLIPVAWFLRHRLRGAVFSPIVAFSGFLLMVSLTSLIASFAVMPIATAIAIFFVEPLLLTVLAGPLLGERAGPRRLIAVGVGLVGALIVVRPGFSEFGGVTALPLVGAFAYALNMIVLKRATATRSGLTVQCGATIYAAAGLAVWVGVLHHLETPNLVPSTASFDAWIAIVCTGVVATICCLLIAEAYRTADATVLAPLQYLEIVTATVLGFLVFGEFPDALTWLGVAIILGLCAYIFHHERHSTSAAPRRRLGGR